MPDIAVQILQSDVRRHSRRHISVISSRACRSSIRLHVRGRTAVKSQKYGVQATCRPAFEHWALPVVDRHADGSSKTLARSFETDFAS